MSQCYYCNKNERDHLGIVQFGQLTLLDKTSLWENDSIHALSYLEQISQTKRGKAD